MGGSVERTNGTFDGKEDLEGSRCLMARVDSCGRKRLLIRKLFRVAMKQKKPSAFPYNTEDVARRRAKVTSYTSLHVTCATMLVILLHHYP